MKITKSDLEKLLSPLLEPIRQLNTEVNAFLKKNPDFFKKLGHYLDNFPIYHKENWVKLARQGWCLNWLTPVTVESALDSGKTYLDKFMAAHLTQDWDKLTGKIISLYPHRKHVFDAAFDLHKNQQNYIASIPLFFSQIDGICAENLGVYLFSEHERRQQKIQDLTDASGDLLTNVFLEVLNSRTQFGESISSKSKAKKELAPNRNGVLHGSRKHLDYGTEINSLKAFSLLAFVVYCFEENQDE
jgi:hypothetical protein